MPNKINPSWFPWAAGLLAFCILYALAILIGRFLSRRRRATLAQADASTLIRNFGSNAYEEALHLQRQAQSDGRSHDGLRSPKHWELVRLEIKNRTSRVSGEDLGDASTSQLDSVRERNKTADIVARSGKEGAEIGREKRLEPERAAIEAAGGDGTKDVPEITDQTPPVYNEQDPIDSIDGQATAEHLASARGATIDPAIRPEQAERSAVDAGVDELTTSSAQGAGATALKPAGQPELPDINADQGDATQGVSEGTEEAPPVHAEQHSEVPGVDPAAGKASTSNSDATSSDPASSDNRPEQGKINAAEVEPPRAVFDGTGSPPIPRAESYEQRQTDAESSSTPTSNIQTTSNTPAVPADRKASDVAEGKTTQHVPAEIDKAPFVYAEHSERGAFDAVESQKASGAPEGSRAVTLLHVERPGIEDRMGVHFPMTYCDRSVRVLVTRLALAGNRPPLNESYLARFEKDRELFETVAREKFNPDWPTTKITITQDDMLGASSSPTALLKAAVDKASKPRGGSATPGGRSKPSDDK